MADQAQLFEQSLIEETMSDGTPITPWQRAVMVEWHHRHPQPLVWGTERVRIPMVPRGVYCLDCQTPSVIFPGQSLEYPENKGYCICPKCSLSEQASVGPIGDKR